MIYRQHLILAACALVSAAAQKKDGIPSPHPSLPKTAQTKNAAILNINNYTTWQRSGGQGQMPPSNGGNGGVFPRGTAWVMYADGFIWGAKTYADPAYTQPTSQLIRVGGSTYNEGNKVGWVEGFGPTARAVSSDDPRARIYRIRRDYASMLYWELTRDAAENGETSTSLVTASAMAEVLRQYETDWNEWPVDLGAPYIERNGNPGYQKPPPFSDGFTHDSLISGKYDEPGIAGSDPYLPGDQVIWFVCNDLNISQMQSFAGSNPMGLEVQMTLWAYDRSDWFGSVYMKKLIMINKGGGLVNDTTRGALYLDSVFVGQWSDPDVGRYTDDLIGYDTSLALAFAYNGNRVDEEYARFGLPPPSAGYDWLQGPIVPSPGDTAIQRLMLLPGYRNLPPTSFVHVASLAMEDAWFYELTQRYWRLLRGFAPDPSPSPLRYYPTPPGIAQTTFLFTGDPVSGSGFLDGLDWLTPGDRRFVLGCGPFRLAPGDTQEIIVAGVAALGADRLSSISALRLHDRAVQDVYDASLDFPRAPAPPRVTAIELNSEVILEWGSPAGFVSENEGLVVAGKYNFEGYVVYQLPRSDAPLSEAVRVATFDKVNDISTILGITMDPVSGALIPILRQKGTNTGLKRSIRITRDAISDHDLRNGTDYYFAVTAYNAAVDPLGVASQESDPVAIHVRPATPFGASGLLNYGDTIAVSHTSGSGTGTVLPTVVNPLASTGNTYEVRFNPGGTGIVWSLWNVTENRSIASDLPLHSGPDDPPIVEGGLLLKVSGSFSTTDVFRYETAAIDSSWTAVQESIERISVYPNPTNGESWAMFSNLPRHAVIRIFSLTGEQVRKLEKNDPSQFLRWDLMNEASRQVASGIYLCVVEMPDLNQTRVLKLAVIQSRVYPGGW